jgi:hypothetical protein
VCVAGALLAGCNTIQEHTLSTRQRIVTINNAGDGVSPPTTVVLLERRRGVYEPIYGGHTAAPVTAFVAGAGAGIATGIGLASVRPSRTIVTQSGASARATGGAGGAGGAGGSGGSGGTNTQTNTQNNTQTVDQTLCTANNACRVGGVE